MAKINCKSGFPINQAENDSEEDCELPAELARLLEHEEKEIYPHKEPVDVINLGSETDRKEVKIRASLAKHVHSELVVLLHEYVAVFAWSYQDMPGLDTNIVEHHLPLKTECPPIKQKIRRTRPDMALKIKEEVKNQFDAGFLAISEYPQWVANIVPVPKKKAIKGSVLSDYLAHLPIEGYQPLRFDFPNKDIMFIRDFPMPGFEAGPEEGPEPGSRWTLVFDDASNARGHGIGVVITSPTDFHLPFTARLCFDCTNNMAEYEACIYGLEEAIDLRIKILEVYGDLALVISQVKGDSETRDSKLIPYKEYIRKLVAYFDEISFHHTPREENQLADALATLASMFKVKWKNEVPAIHIDHLDEPSRCLAIEADPDDKPWFYDIKTFLEKQQYPEGISIIDKKALRRLSPKFFLNGDVLYKRNYDSVLLRCVDRHEASTIVKSIHEGCEGVHAKGPAMAKKILRVGYYWTTMEVDCYNFVRRCHKCQIYGDKIFVPPTPLNVLTYPWPFSMWGIDMIGMIEAKASNGHRFILVSIDYFTK
ncbi:uncharacterized protein LOC127102217 [Lathyrus oleraceus]|uniref:uncharacterized protein LOC127102217 n=1 Tax=Pisum sativum TaxID=3888 RepID=UPI0021D0337E|nr:uncharacterized protein LOC127102217 [Pisum sativum]